MTEMQNEQGLTVSDDHKITYGGSERLGFWWRCKCGNAMGVPDAPADDDRLPFEQAFDRTYWAHEHLETQK